jgi:hypothetical protein
MTLAKLSAIPCLDKRCVLKVMMPILGDDDVVDERPEIPHWQEFSRAKPRRLVGLGYAQLSGNNLETKNGNGKILMLLNPYSRSPQQ